LRYVDIETVVFTDVDGNDNPVKDIREISDQVQSFEIDVKESDSIDEIASRSSVYGESGELQSYKIHDLNIVKLVENNFDVGKLKRLKIPVR
jgi:hypothetical protein